ncbi:MAG: hypothetical protein KJ646_03290 [Nanoarchaeota archaeon]|nr:hypothetical protein [Nanoarchaeota archaeon]MBU4116258.1 hypothetical protein [Nanoarchaeota archaeon]
MKNIKIILSPEAREVYQYLNQEAPTSKTERMILKSVRQKVDLIKANPHYGNPVAKKLIPNEYKEKYNTVNLFRIELPNFWRMLYTLTEGETQIEIIAFVLDIIDHKTYNKKFGYKKK